MEKEKEKEIERGRKRKKIRKKKRRGRAEEREGKKGRETSGESWRQKCSYRSSIGVKNY